MVNMSVIGDEYDPMEVQKRSSGEKSPGGDEREYDLGSEKLDGTLHAKHAFVIFEKSRILNTEEFHRQFRAKFPTAEMFGSREWHADGTCRYHVVMRFPFRKNLKNARKRLLLDGEDGEVVVRVKSVNKSIQSFLEGTQAFCAKGNNPDTFGTWLEPCVKTMTHTKQEEKEVSVGSEPRLGKKAQTKRKYEKIMKEKDRETAKQMLCEADPRGFIFNYWAVLGWSGRAKRRRTFYGGW